MALIATLTFPVEVVSADLLSSPITARFPVPPTAWGFCTDVDFDWEQIGIKSPYYIMGAIQPESDYLEPTTGQIWPRIG